MMDNIDELMKEKFDNDDPRDRFEFKEAYWEQAQRLIEADEAKRRRRRRLLFVLFFLLFGAGAGLWHGMEDTQDGQAAQNAPIEHGTQSTAASEDDRTTNASTPREGLTPETARNARGAADETNQSKPDAANTATAKSGENVEKTGANQRKNTRSGDFSKKGNGENTTGQDRTLPLLTADSRQSQVGEVAGQNSTGTVGSEDRNKGMDSTKTDNAALPGLRPDVVPVAAEEQGKNTGMESEKQGKNAGIELSEGLTIPIKNAILPLLLAPLQKAPQPLILDATQLVLPAIIYPEPMASVTKKFEDRKPLELAVYAIGTWKTSQNEYNSALDNPNWGAALGLRAKWRPLRRGALALGLGARYLPGSWAKPDSLGQPILTGKSSLYSFGLNQTTETIEVLGLTYLEAMLGYRFEYRRFGIEAGAMPRYLLAAHAKYTSVTDAPFQDARTQTERFRRFEDDQYRKFYLPGYAALDYNLRGRVSLSLGAGFSPKLPRKYSTGADIAAPKALHWLELGVHIGL
jgi:hypothetical protein